MIDGSNTKLRNTESALFVRRNQHDDDKEHDDDDDEEEEDDDLPPSVDIANFKAPQLSHSFGYGKGRSSPSIRTAMGMSGKSTAHVYVCTNCGGESVQWRGKCPTCQQWNTLQSFQMPRKLEHINPRMAPIFGRSLSSSSSPSSTTWLEGIGGDESSLYQRPVPITQVDLKTPSNARILIPYDDEVNAVLGGGLLKGSLILLGGDPGVGKSTLALQLANQVASHVSTPTRVGIGMGSIRSMNNKNTTTTTIAQVGPVWYVSGEETLQQIATRAQRLQNALSEQLYLLSETNLNVLAEQVIQWTHPTSTDNIDIGNDEMLHDLPPSLIVIDSIQTVHCEAATGGSPGGISQVRECMALLLRLAKSTHIPILVIGHVTKTGDVAGPRMVEHMVDAVLYLEGGSATSDAPYRWLRATKNRFGSTQVVGLYEFIQGQLRPSPELDTSSSNLMPMEDLEGCAMSIAVEGLQRAMTVEVQALVAMSGGSFGKKTVDGGGLSYQRLQLLLGVLQKHCSVFIGKSRDVYVNVVGASSMGGNSRKAAASAFDLAVAVALTSSLVSIPVRGDTVFLAQIGLLGELRSVANLEARLLQAQRMGFSRVVVAGRRFQSKRQYGMQYMECPTLRQALELGLTAAIPRKRKSSTSSKTISADHSKTNPNKRSSPERMEDLELTDIILDDAEDDGDEDYYY